MVVNINVVPKLLCSHRPVNLIFFNLCHGNVESKFVSLASIMQSLSLASRLWIVSGCSRLMLMNSLLWEENTSLFKDFSAITIWCLLLIRDAKKLTWFMSFWSQLDKWLRSNLEFSSSNWAKLGLRIFGIEFESIHFVQ